MTITHIVHEYVGDGLVASAFMVTHCTQYGTNSMHVSAHCSVKRIFRTSCDTSQHIDQAMSTARYTVVTAEEKTIR